MELNKGKVEKNPGENFQKFPKILINATSAAENKSQYGKSAQRIRICIVMSKIQFVSLMFKNNGQKCGYILLLQYVELISFTGKMVSLEDLDNLD